MKTPALSLLILLPLLVVSRPAAAQAPTTRSGRPVDPEAIENLNKINDARAQRGQKPITAPGYTYVPADQRAPAAPKAPRPLTPLTWIALVGQPEFWPSQCALTVTLDFEGATLKAGQQVKVDAFHPKAVDLSTLDDKLQFTVPPEQTDVLDVANAAYAKLTPKQRELNYVTLMMRRDLWPYRVKLTQTFDLGRNTRLKAGDEVVLLKVERTKLTVLAEKLRTTTTVDPVATDFLAQARQFVEDTNGAPSRLITELDGKLVNSVTGQPDPLPANAQPRYIVFFRGSSTCAITRKFAPTLIKYDNETKSKHPEYEIVYIMTETPEDTGKFAKELGFSWRAVGYETTGKMPVTNAGKTFSDLIPQLVVMDRTGKVLANGIQGTAPAALTQLDSLLNQPNK